MALQFSVAVRNARLDAIETTIGASSVLRFRTGAPPANAGTADSGTVLATLTLPSDYFSAASGGVKSLLGVWTDAAADATGTVGHFRFYDSTGVTCHIQGTVTATGGGGDMEAQTVSFVTGQPINVTSYAVTEGNA